MKKVDVALELGAEAIMDLSNTGKTHSVPQRASSRSRRPHRHRACMYDAIGYLEKPITITVEDFLDVRAHAEDGVDFVTTTAGMNRHHRVSVS